MSYDDALKPLPDKSESKIGGWCSWTGMLLAMAVQLLGCSVVPASKADRVRYAQAFTFENSGIVSVPSIDACVLNARDIAYTLNGDLTVIQDSGGGPSWPVQLPDGYAAVYVQSMFDLDQIVITGMKRSDAGSSSNIITNLFLINRKSNTIEQVTRDESIKISPAPYGKDNGIVYAVLDGKPSSSKRSHLELVAKNTAGIWSMMKLNTVPLSQVSKLATCESSRRIVAEAQVEGSRGVFGLSVDGEPQAELLIAHAGMPALSRNGSTLACLAADSNGIGENRPIALQSASNVIKVDLETGAHCVRKLNQFGIFSRVELAGDDNTIVLSGRQNGHAGEEAPGFIIASVTGDKDPVIILSVQASDQ